MARRLAVLVAALALGLATSAAWADGPGQDDLDKATESKLKARNLRDLGDVINLCESAIKKGLDKDTEDFARLMLAATLVQRGILVARNVTDAPRPDPNWAKMRDFALGDLEKGVKLDPNQAEAFLLIAQLNLLPGGDAKRVTKALDDAIANAAEQPEIKARALVLRANTIDDLKKRRVDLDEAIRTYPSSAQALFSRGLVLADLNELDAALADLNKVIELKPDHGTAHEAKAIVLARQKKYDEALVAIDEARELDPDSVFPLLQRARIHALQKNYNAALYDLDQAATAAPGEIQVLLLRASVHQELKQRDKALEDVEKALRLKPNHGPALRLKALLLAGEGHMEQAIEQLEKLRKDNPKDPTSLLQLAMFYSAQENYEKAVEMYTAVLEQNPNEFLALRGRGDALLGIGKHAEAIADYERGLKAQPDDAGLLNNFAWVLCTSPEEKLRNGKRSIELATRACEKTSYREAHILSTLGAAYAESGDFATARKWSQKAIEVADPEQKEALEKELVSYKAGKPIREKKLPTEKKPEAKSESKPAAKPQAEPAKTEAKPAAKPEAKP